MGKAKTRRPISNSRTGRASYREYPYEPKPDDVKYQPLPNPEPEPQSDNTRYKPSLGFFDKLVKSRAEKKIQIANELYASEHAAMGRKSATN